MRSKYFFTTVLAAVVLTASAESTAETVTFEITATVANIYDPYNALESSVNAGDKVTGTYTMDTATPDDDPNPNFGHYIFAPPSGSPSQLGFDLLVGSHSLKSDPVNPGHRLEAHVMNDYSDHFGLWSWGNTPLANGSSVDDIILDMYDGTGQALISDRLSAEAPPVNNYEFHNLTVSGSSLTGEFYTIDAIIDSISVAGGACTTPSSPVVKVKISATVRDVYDYDNALGTTVQTGDAVTGTYTFNTTTQDADPSPEYGLYEHQPGSGDYGFDINIGGSALQTNTATDMFSIFIHDSATYPDFYGVDHFGSSIPFINDTVVNGVGIYVDDPTGALFNSDALTDNPPDINNAGYRELYISGQGGSANNAYFSIIADLESITEVDGCEENNSALMLSPGDGVFDRHQQFDAAVILEPGLGPLMEMYGTLNGYDVTPELLACYPGAPNNQNRQTLVCPKFSDLLMQGNNTLSVTLTLEDGSVITNSVNWEIVGF